MLQTGKGEIELNIHFYKCYNPPPVGWEFISVMNFSVGRLLFLSSPLLCSLLFSSIYAVCLSAGPAVATAAILEEHSSNRVARCQHYAYSSKEPN